MLLSLRGWGPDAFTRAGPELLAGARWALYAERLMPQLVQLREVQDIDMADVVGSKRGRVGRAKAEAKSAIPAYLDTLFPEDD